MIPHKGAGERAMKTNHIKVKLPKQKIAGFCRRHHIRKLAVFGSALREDIRPDSDLDVLVEFEPEHTPGLIGLAGMEIKLSALLGGRKVDMNTPRCLSPFFRDEVLAEAEPVYVAGRPPSSPASQACAIGSFTAMTSWITTSFGAR